MCTHPYSLIIRSFILRLKNWIRNTLQLENKKNYSYSGLTFPKPYMFMYPV